VAAPGDAALPAPLPPQAEVRAEGAARVDRPAPHRRVEQGFVDANTRTDHAAHVRDQILGRGTRADTAVEAGFAASVRG
jgi:hypothetical protein